ncbi:aminoglycoside phosphotransferase family protein [Mucilaginibacter sp. UR6-1]|uniref:phosphotransferase enzyme family protein n=1 Tax=Mucilaginibacter sp. UR6-1 TaxID=1435643 RepID=UPI001E55760A|nr:aminoglycoside phosphotransferase family protein [Mucilaginibacter sp. UR6-1]
MQSVENIAEIVANFNCNADTASLRNFGSGHINDTYFLKNIDAGGSDYLLQRINHHIFTNVAALTDNMCLVINHLKTKVNPANADKEVMTLIPGRDGNYFYRDKQGDYWRLCFFLSDTKSYDVVKTEKQAFEGGKAFGKFQCMLADLDPDVLFEVIPDFHNISTRLASLQLAVNHDMKGRAASVKPQLDYIAGYAETMQYFQKPQQQSVLPKRVTHNDTKFNNVLLNSNDEAQCVIDLDTVMPGYVAYDFGDAIRTIINTTVEDEADLDKIQLNLPLFNAYTKGYLLEAGRFLTKAEANSLIMGVLLLPYMQAVRFLTDHINGDTYFKTNFEGHNLQRAKAQLRLFGMLDANKEALHQTIIRQMENFGLGAKLSV